MEISFQNDSKKDNYGDMPDSVKKYLKDDAEDFIKEFLPSEENFKKFVNDFNFTHMAGSAEAFANNR